MFSYLAHEVCQTTNGGKHGTIDVPLDKTWKNIVKTFRKLIGGAITLAGAAVIVTQHF